jgi:hypothetical protein
MYIFLVIDKPKLRAQDLTEEVSGDNLTEEDLRNLDSKAIPFTR